MEHGVEVGTLVGHANKVTAVAVMQGRRAISASDDQTIKVWDLQTGRELVTLSGHKREVRAVVVSSDNWHAISTSYNGTLRVWNIQQKTELYAIQVSDSPLYAVVETQDARFAVCTAGDILDHRMEPPSQRKMRTLLVIHSP